MLARINGARITNRENGKVIRISKEELDAFAVGMLTAREMIVDGFPSDDPLVIVRAFMECRAAEKLARMEDDGSVPLEEDEGGAND